MEDSSVFFEEEGPKEDTVNAALLELAIKERENAVRELLELSLREPPFYSGWDPVGCLPDEKRFYLDPIKSALIPGIPRTEGRGPRMDKNLCIEFMGFPRAGKTHTQTELGKIMPDLVVVPEFQIGGVYPKEAIDLLPEPVRWLILEAMKLESILDYFSADIEAKIASLSEGKLSYIHRTIMRGPNDALALLRGITDMYKEAAGAGTRNLVETVMYNRTYKALQCIEDVDAVILYDIDFHTAVERRIKDGLHAYGRLVSPFVWPLLKLSYDWYFHYAFPFLHDKYGTGLLVVDGRRPPEENLAAVADYIARLRKMAEFTE